MYESTLIGSKNADDDQRACITYVRMRDGPDYLRTYSHYASHHSSGSMCYGYIEANIEVAHAYGIYYGEAQAKLIAYWKDLSNDEKRQKLKSVGIEIDSPQAHNFMDELDANK
jgi:hypothetical protein